MEQTFHVPKYRSDVCWLLAEKSANDDMLVVVESRESSSEWQKTGQHTQLQFQASFVKIIVLHAAYICELIAEQSRAEEIPAHTQQSM